MFCWTIMVADWVATILLLLLFKQNGSNDKKNE